MTIAELVAWCDRVKPNGFTTPDKIAWINEVESVIQLQVLLIDPMKVRVYDPIDDLDTELIAQPPWDKVYRSYLVAKLDEANGEYNKYANTYQTYNNHIGEYQRYIARVYNPAERPLELVDDTEYILRGTTASVQFELPIAADEIAAMTVNFMQQVGEGRQTVLSLTLADAVIEDGICTLTLTQEQSLMLQKGYVLVAVIIVTTDDKRMESWPWKKIRVRETSEDQVVTA